MKQYIMTTWLFPAFREYNFGFWSQQPTELMTRFGSHWFVDLKSSALRINKENGEALRINLCSDENLGSSAEEPQTRHDQAGRDETAAREQLNTEVLMRAVYDGASDWRTNQQSNGCDGETHAQPCPEAPHVLGQADHHYRRQRHKATREKAVQHRKNDDPRGIMDTNPAQSKDSRNGSGRPEYVYRPHVVGNEIWDDSTESGGCIEHGEKIES